MSVTATQVARSFSDFVNRVHYKGETFVIERGGEAIAQLSPPYGVRNFSIGHFVENLKTLPKVDDDFAADLEHGIKNQPPAEGSRWS